MALIELYRSGRQREAWTDVGGVGVGRRPRSETLRYFFSDPRFLHLQKIHDGSVGIELLWSRRSPSKLTVSLNVSERIFSLPAPHTVSLYSTSLTDRSHSIQLESSRSDASPSAATLRARPL